MSGLLRFSTHASVREVERLAPEALHVERDKGMTTFALRERDAECVMSEMRRADIVVYSGYPRVSYSSPRAYASAASHLRVH